MSFMISLYAYMPAACLYLFIYISIWYIFLYNLLTSHFLSTLEGDPEIDSEGEIPQVAI
jgi:hypothetical protein